MVSSVWEKSKGIATLIGVAVGVLYGVHELHQRGYLDFLLGPSPVREQKPLAKTKDVTPSERSASGNRVLTVSASSKKTKSPPKKKKIRSSRPKDITQIQQEGATGRILKKYTKEERSEILKKVLDFGKKYGSGRASKDSPKKKKPRAQKLHATPSRFASPEDPNRQRFRKKGKVTDQKAGIQPRKDSISQTRSAIQSNPFGDTPEVVPGLDGPDFGFVENNSDSLYSGAESSSLASESLPNQIRKPKNLKGVSGPLAGGTFLNQPHRSGGESAAPPILRKKRAPPRRSRKVVKRGLEKNEILDFLRELARNGPTKNSESTDESRETRSTASLASSGSEENHQDRVVENPKAKRFVLESIGIDSDGYTDDEVDDSFWDVRTQKTGIFQESIADFVEESDHELFQIISKNDFMEFFEEELLDQEVRQYGRMVERVYAFPEKSNSKESQDQAVPRPPEEKPKNSNSMPFRSHKKSRQFHESKEVESFVPFRRSSSRSDTKQP